MPVGEERLERANDQGVDVVLELGRLPKFADWKRARSTDASLLSEWQIYRMLEAHKGAWAAFQYLVRERLLEDGVEVSPEGAVRAPQRSRRGGGGTSRPPAARAPRGSASPRNRGRD